MICYKKTNGRAHDIRFVSDDCVPGPGEAVIAGDVLPSVDSLSDPEDPKIAHNALIDAQIDGIERATLLSRGVREFILPSMLKIGQDLGLTAQQLYDQQPGYRRLKDLDEQIKALRALRKP